MAKTLKIMKGERLTSTKSEKNLGKSQLGGTIEEKKTRRQEGKKTRIQEDENTRIHGGEKTRRREGGKARNKKPKKTTDKTNVLSTIILVAPPVQEKTASSVLERRLYRQL